MTIRVLSVASEAYPLVKTGGLADVVGALPAALAAHDVETTTLIPGYPAVTAKLGKARAVHRWPALLGTPARLLAGEIEGNPLLVLDTPELFARDGNIYADPGGKDWHDNWRRFAALARAAADLGSGAVKGRAYDVVHAHDWQAALAPVYLGHAPAGETVARSVITIHNIAFQGWFEPGILPWLGLPDDLFTLDGIEFFGGVGYLKGGMQFADAITTVSPSYAQEILSPEFGMGLEGLVAARRDRVSGIVNGIDPAIWNPATDTTLPARYTDRTLGKRAANKRAVEARFGLEPGDGPIFTVVSRLTWQKGMDVLGECVDDLVTMGGRLALLGSGDLALEEAFRLAADRHPGRVGVMVGYDEPVSHLLQGGADAILIPSRFEPCGLTQLYGLAYGCVPVVARTGGLADTIIDANEAALAAGVATGIQFTGVSREALTTAIARTVRLYADRATWATIQKRGMRSDFSWDRSGLRYVQLYRGLLNT